MRGLLGLVGFLAAASALEAWTPGTANPAPTSGFSVDTSSRNDVASFWHGVYVPSDFYWERMGWTGNYSSTATGAEGSNSAAFVDDVERRINFVRALCGVPSGISMNTSSTVLIETGDTHQPASSTTKRSAVQRSALVVALGATSDAISHTPPSSLPGWTTAAWNGHNKSAMAKGFYGPGAVDVYFREDVLGSSNWNIDVGHRRWLLSVPVTDMATGDTPGSFNPATSQIVQPSNLIYVKPNPSEVSSDAARFVSYPGQGFFPVGLNTPYWSLSRGGANFASASVTMTDDSGASVPITVVSRKTGYAENAIVWSVPDSVRSSLAPVDRSYHLTVSGITGIAESSYSWSVTLFDPNRVEDSLGLSGPSTVVASAGANFTLPSVPGCDSINAGFFLRESATWTETAENGAELYVIDRSDPSYDLRAGVSQTAPGFPSNYYAQGSKAFRLTFPRAYDPRLNTIGDEVFEIDRQVIPGSSASVKFQFRRGYMAATTALACEQSADGGLTWQAVGSPLLGSSGGSAESGFSLVTLPLNQSSDPLHLRFRLYRTDPLGGFYDHERYPTYATGVFIDELRVEGCDWLKPGGLIQGLPSGGSVNFASSTATLPIVMGQPWSLRARPVMGGHAFPWGPIKVVTPIGPLGISGNSEPPVSGATYTFIPDPAADSHLFEVSRFSPGSWTEGAEVDAAPSVIDGTSSTYTLISNRAGFRVSGNSSFRLAVQPSDGEDYFEINREVIATSESQLSFWLRRGWSSNQTLDVEVSTNGGSSWSSVWSMVGSLWDDPSGGSHLVDLSAYEGEAIRCRFVLRSTGAVSYFAAFSGMWIDDVAMTDVNDVYSSLSTPVAGGQTTVIFNTSTVGETPLEGAIYRLRMISVVGGVPGEEGEAFFVTPTGVVLSAYEAWVAFEYPSIVGSFEDTDGTDGVANGIKYAFGIDPSTAGAPGDEVEIDDDYLTLERELESLREGVLYEAESSNNLSSWSTVGVTVTHEAGVLRARVARPEGPIFLRWKITEE